jgi:hypothetical protein
LPGDGDKGIEKEFSEEKIFSTGLTKAARAEQKSLVTGHDKHNKSTKEGPFSFVLFETPFTSVSTVSRWPPLSLLTILLAISFWKRTTNNYRENIFITKNVSIVTFYVLGFFSALYNMFVRSRTRHARFKGTVHRDGSG